jgi:hypothetical protein
MSGNVQISKRSVLLVGIAVGVMLVIAAYGPNFVQASNTVAETWVSCTPVEVAVYTAGSARLHVRCAAAVGGISFFALSTADASVAARVLSVLSTAQVAGRTLSILYDPADLSGGQIGCATNDCRLIRAVAFGQ